MASAPNGGAEAPKDKVLVVGSNGGSLKALLAKVVGINSKHGPFSCLLCLGDLFNPSSGEHEQEVADVLAGHLAFPVPTYFIQGDSRIPQPILDKSDKENGEICENLSFLGKQTILTLSSGLKIGVFGGKFELEQFQMDTQPSSSPYFAATSLDAFTQQPATASIDVLLLNTWPSQVTRFSEKPLSETVNREQVERWGVPALRKLISKARPKYAFVGNENLFWEREPFVHPTQEENQGQSATRFLSIGHFGNATKQRWFYAFNIVPTSVQPNQDIPATVTPCPFDISGSGPRGMKRNRPDTGDDEAAGNYIFAGTQDRSESGKKKRHGEPPPNYKCKICGIPGHFVQDCPEKIAQPPPARHTTAKRNPPPSTYVCRLCNQPGHWIQDCSLSSQDAGGRGPPKEIAREFRAYPSLITSLRTTAADECWFCLSNPNVTKHLIASIGGETYLTLPKGQLPDAGDEECLVPGGGHCLIIPIAHYPTLSAVPSELSAPIYAEIDAYKRALRECYAQYRSSPLAWEVSRVGHGAKSAHAHIQICPVPNRLASEAEKIFMREAQEAGYDFVSDRNEERKKDLDMTLQGGNYFRVDLPDGSKLVHRIRPNERFNLQFGRTTAALVLGTPGRSDWKACAKPDDEEGQDCQAFKQAFAKYDPST